MKLKVLDLAVEELNRNQSHHLFSMASDNLKEFYINKCFLTIVILPRKYAKWEHTSSESQV